MNEKELLTLKISHLFPFIGIFLYTLTFRNFSDVSLNAGSKKNSLCVFI